MKAKPVLYFAFGLVAVMAAVIGTLAWHESQCAVADLREIQPILSRRRLVNRDPGPLVPGGDTAPAHYSIYQIDEPIKRLSDELTDKLRRRGWTVKIVPRKFVPGFSSPYYALFKATSPARQTCGGAADQVTVQLCAAAVFEVKPGNKIPHRDSMMTKPSTVLSLEWGSRLRRPWEPAINAVFQRPPRNNNQFRYIHAPEE